MKLLLKIPVYLSEMKEHDTGTLFDLKEQDIIDKLKRDIKTYNEKKSNLCQFGKWKSHTNLTHPVKVF